MNAHTPRALADALDLTPCPVELIGRQIKSVQDQLDRLADLTAVERPAEEGQLHDLLAMLDAQLEWTVPTSAAGVALIVAQANVIAEGLVDGDCDRERLQRRLARLHARALDGLARLGGIDLVAIGAGAKVLSEPPSRAVLERL